MLPTLFVIVALAVLYWFPLRRWFGHGARLLKISPA